jgi:predicted esterase
MVLVGAAVFAVALGRAQRRAEAVLQRQLVIEAPWGRERVLVITPRRPADRAHPEVERWPILVALHGRGEAVRGRDRGFLAWSIDYRLPDAFGALRRGHLTVSDFGGLVRPARLAAIRAELARRPFAGLAVVCPYTPDLIAEPPGSPAILEYGQWIAGPMLAQVRALIPELGRTRASSGIDGVSLGGMLALEIGFRHPEAFATVGAIQPAIRGREHAIAALARSDGSQRIRLLTSDRDPFLGPTRVLSEALRNRGVRHELDVVTGPHDYAFNRGPGGIEMLLWHERVLAREPL